MKKPLLSLCTALILAVSLAPASFAAARPTPSTNLNADDYYLFPSDEGYTEGKLVNSYLYQDSGQIVRVECVDNTALRHKVAVETYDSDFTLQDAQTIQMDEAFPYFAGFFAGEHYNFLFSYEANWEMEDGFPVLQAVKYDKDWNRLDAGQAADIDARALCQGGSFRVAEAGGTLYIHTCREMHNRHQAATLLALDEESLIFTDLSQYAFVSHSFDQHIVVDSQGRLILQDLGDFNPRGHVLSRVTLGQSSFKDSLDRFTLTEYPQTDRTSADGEEIYRVTGATLGGLAETSSGYLAASGDTGLGNEAVPGKANYNVELTYIPKNGFSASSAVKRTVTSYSGSQSAGTPMLVSTGRDGGYLLWKVQEKQAGGYRSTGKVSYVTYSGDGSVSAVQTVEAPFSDCCPIPYEGGLLWYVTQNGDPTFYTLKNGKVTSAKAQTPSQSSASTGEAVPAGEWYTEAANYALERGLMDLVDGQFAPTDPADRYTIIQALYRIQDIPGGYPSNFTDVTPDMKEAVDWAYGKSIALGRGDGTFGPHDPVTRQEFSLFLWRYAGLPGVEAHNAEFNDYLRVDLSAYTDIGEIGYFAGNSMRWIVYVGLMKGTSDTTLSPEGTITRAELATLLMRFEQNMLHK